MFFTGKFCVFIAFLTGLSAVAAVDANEEPPSTPVCMINGKAEEGENIYLSCHSDKGSPKPVYRWNTQDVRNRPRLLDQRATSMGGFLALYDIGRDTSGYYTCTSRNKLGSASCNIILTVLPPSASFSFQLGAVSGVIAGAAASVALAAQRFILTNATSGQEGPNAN